MTKPTPEEGPSNYQEQVDSEATPVLLNNEDVLIYVDHATPSHGNAEARGRSASPDSPYQLLKETAIIQLQSALKWADMVEDVERDSALINYEEVKRKEQNLNLNEGDLLEYPRLGNLWCLWKFSFNAPVLVAASSQHLTISYDGLLLSAIHGLASISARRALWTDMESIANLNLPWLAIGDFNCIRSWDERSG
ncbi:hypothetical protein GIB67_028619, partial [Kingdonia uniflora]